MSALSRLRHALVAGVLVLCAGVVGAGPAGSPPAELRIVAFNVLAPVWASPVWYDADLDESLLEREFRRGRTGALLSSLAPSVDAFCLQEMSSSELPHVLQALGPEFVGLMAQNDPGYWSNWLVPGLPWEPNGTFVAVRSARFTGAVFQDLTLSGSGNHAAAFEGIDRASGRPVRIYSVHFDSDSNRNRRLEIGALLAEARPDASAVDVVCGDVNEEASLGSAATLFRAAGFVDVLSALGQREPTHPFTSSYNRSPRWAIIDHVLVRNAAPVAGEVIDFGLDAVDDEIARIEGNLRASGSDHYPVAATVGW